MSDTICVLGCDPGGTTGFFLASWRPASRAPFTRAWQCGMDGAAELAGWILGSAYGDTVRVLGIEAFDSRLSGKRLKGFRPEAQHELIKSLESAAASRGIKHVTWTPGTVKPWATDARLQAAKLDEAVGKMRDDALDAARICLYTACKLLGLPVPRGGSG